MSDKDIRLSERWIGFDEFVGLLQKSLQLADLRLAREPVGDISYAVADLSISAPVALGVVADSDRPVLRLPSTEELMRTGENVARLTFTLRPVPAGEEAPRTPRPNSEVGKLVEGLSDQDYRDRLRAIKALASMGHEAVGAIEILRRVAETDRSSVVQAAAKEAVKTLTG